MLEPMPETLGAAPIVKTATFYEDCLGDANKKASKATNSHSLLGEHNIHVLIND
jgi:hypothetical protein